MSGPHSSRSLTAPSSLAALGIVFGDLGTSPLYALQECFTSHIASAGVRADILGCVSLILWSLISVVTIKYMVFLLRVDNRGEGGILALLAMLPPHAPKPGKVARASVGMLLAIVGAALLFGDGIITPAVSVLSAVEGLSMATPRFTPYVLPLTVAILIGLFAVQSKGTDHLARYFGPVMLLWFGTAFVLGVRQIVHDPAVLIALSPGPGIQFFARHGAGGIRVLGGVVLAVTGGEALYADLGHFGRAPIQRAWLWVCTPALAVNYLGQAALLSAHPEAVEHPFFAMCPPGPTLYVVVAIAAAATVIASQALISGVFSLTHQAIQLGLFPRITVTHTSARAEGQIYVPAMNTFLAAACISLVLGFRESSRLAAAFGLAVSGTMAITSVLFYMVVRHALGWSRTWATALLCAMLAIDIPFVIANSLKLLDGGWLPLVIGSFFTVIMLVWYRGRTLLAAYFVRHQMPLEKLCADVARGEIRRLHGIGVFLSARAVGTPLPMSRMLERFRCVYETNIFLSVLVDRTPTVDDAQRFQVERISESVTRIVLHFGFMEPPHVLPHLQRALASIGRTDVAADCTFVLGRETIAPSDGGALGRIEEELFAFLARNAKSPTDWFNIPIERVVELGARVDL